MESVDKIKDTLNAPRHTISKFLCFPSNEETNNSDIINTEIVYVEDINHLKIDLDMVTDTKETPFTKFSISDIPGVIDAVKTDDDETIVSESSVSDKDYKVNDMHFKAGKRKKHEIEESFSDEGEEIKRLNARKAYKNRQQKKEKEKEKEEALNKITTERDNLIIKVKLLDKEIECLKQRESHWNKERITWLKREDQWNEDKNFYKKQVTDLKDQIKTLLNRYNTVL